jgi:[acyl-carrier-protein] S-malonyltransferase
MGKVLAEASGVARALFQEVDEALQQNLTRLMGEGPLEDLTLTENAQPAIMANALATLRVLEQEGGVKLADKADFVAGHSLGEYTALCAAEAFDLPTTARLLKLRGRAMQAAVPVGEGAMAALLGLGLEAAQAVAAEASEGEICTVANDNDPNQVVVSGHTAAVERALEIAKAKGAKRALLLPVSAPFHSPLMESAARAMEEALGQSNVRPPVVPLYANVTAAPAEDPAEIRRLLVEQVTGMVRWRESVSAMAEAGVTHFVEFGGKVLNPMVKRIAPDAKTTSVVSMGDIETLAKEI